MGNVPIGSPYTFTIYSIQVMANLSTQDCQTMWTIIFFTCWQCSSFVMGNDDWLSHLRMKVNWNVKKAPLSHQKMKNPFLYYIQLLMIGQVIQATKFDWNAKKGPLSHQKMKCSFLDYVQLLIIDWAIWAMNVDQNVTKDPLSDRTIKCSFLDYIQLLMIDHAIQATKVNWNAEKGPLSHWKMKYSFYIMFNFWSSAKQSEWRKLIKMWKNEMLFQLGSSVVSVWVFCCFSLGLLLSQSGCSVVFS